MLSSPKRCAARIEDQAALLDRGPRQQAAVRMRDRRVALIGRHVREPRADRLAPQHGFAGRTERAEIGGAGDLRTETAPRDRGFRRSRSRRGSPCRRGSTTPSFITTPATAPPSTISSCAPLPTASGISRFCDERHQVVDEILAAPRDRRMQPRDGVSDVLVGRDELHARAEIIDQPFDGRGRHLRHAAAPVRARPYRRRWPAGRSTIASGLSSMPAAF